MLGDEAVERIDLAGRLIRGKGEEVGGKGEEELAGGVRLARAYVGHDQPTSQSTRSQRTEKVPRQGISLPESVEIGVGAEEQPLDGSDELAVGLGHLRVYVEDIGISTVAGVLRDVRSLPAVAETAHRQYIGENELDRAASDIGDVEVVLMRAFELLEAHFAGRH
jgi:hypothetical protein